MTRLTTALLCTVLYVGCSGGVEPSPESSDTGGTAETTTDTGGESTPDGWNGDGPDQSDPLKVLERFVEAIRAKDKASCVALVHPDDREELGRDMERGFPPVPDEPELAVEVSEQGDSATFTGVPSLDKLELRKSDGKWWIAD